MQNDLLNEIRQKRPIVHCITNHVTANDCANILLACGASPVMADAPEEAAEITAGAQALVLNLGTPSARSVEAMLAAGKQANLQTIPVLLDPVGVGASAFRKNAVKRLLSEVRLTAVRGNLSEIRCLADLHERCAGVDSDADDAADAMYYAKLLAKRLSAVVTVSGETDIVTDGRTAFQIKNGSPVMRQITGAGCMLSALAGAFLAAEPSADSMAYAVCALGIAGETAEKRMTGQDGNASCRNYLIDEIYNMSDAIIRKHARMVHAEGSE
ncbi:MAG: hydroxyethylthiazole kinase [Oscillospiraceae bacterium]|nr:hydroxyethylthiazole kinase [Oscillospiraceae bacterium]